jgi:hypothetical protein
MADEYGYIIKYLAKGVLIDNRFSVSVTPALIKKTSVISNVNEENNIILLSEISSASCASSAKARAKRDRERRLQRCAQGDRARRKLRHAALRRRAGSERY